MLEGQNSEWYVKSHAELFPNSEVGIASMYAV